jgi:hypothetical protein
MDFIDRLRQKSSGTKKRIAFATSAVVTLAIFGVWVSVLHFGIDQKSGDVTAAVANSSDTDVNPLSAFWDVLSKGWNGLTDNINQIKTGVDSAKEMINTLSNATSTATSTDVLILSGDSVNVGNTAQ